MKNRKLYKSNTNKKISGVCGGFAEYFNLDPTIIRVLFVLISIFSTLIGGLIFYIVCSLIIPDDDNIIDG